MVLQINEALKTYSALISVVAALIVAAIFVYDTRAKAEDNAKRNDDQDTVLKLHAAQLKELRDISRSLRELNEQEAAKGRARQELLEQLCRKNRLSEDYCISEGIAQ